MYTFFVHLFNSLIDIVIIRSVSGDCIEQSLGLGTEVAERSMTVYDWMGSRSTHPEHFAPCFSPQSILYPERDIALFALSLLCIEPQDFRFPLCRDDDELSVFSALSENSLELMIL